MATRQQNLAVLTRGGFHARLMDAASSYPLAATLNDAAGPLFFARQLEAIEAKTYEVLYQELKFRKAFPTASDTPKGAISTTYRTYDARGQVRALGTSAKDLPRVDVGGHETTTPVRWYGNAFGYTVQEIASAQFAGVPLDQMKANAARRIHEENANRIAFFGDAEKGLLGFFTSSVPTDTAPNGAVGASPLWSTKTVDEILADVNAVFSLPIVNTKEAERPNRLGLPTARYNVLAQTRIPDTETTILGYILRNSPYLTSIDQILSIPEFATAGAGSTAVVAAWTADPEKMVVDMIEEAYFHPVQEQGLEYVTNVTSITAGMKLRAPLSAYIREGI